MVLKRSPRNPIITRADVPDAPPDVVDPTSVFNPGSTRWDGGYLLLLRVQTRARTTRFMTARGRDGESFDIAPKTVAVKGTELLGEGVSHVYDARITMVEGDPLVVLAADTAAGCRLAIARTSDFETLELVGVLPDADVRNGVLFPERIGGRYQMLYRPNSLTRDDGPTTGTEIWLAESDDLVSWAPVSRVMSGRASRWDELIGSGPPPLKTESGWLHVYHGVATHFASVNIYQAGAVLLDLRDPSRVVSRTEGNILEPREQYELVGQVPNVVFPTGLVADEYDGRGYARTESRVRLYYGAADTCVCGAESTVGRLIEACGS